MNDVSAAFDKAMGDNYDPIANAATEAMGDVAERAKTLGRASIAAAGFGRKWQNALRSQVYPKGRTSARPAALIYHKIGYAGIFEEGGTIPGKPLLWLPLPSVPMGKGGRRIAAKDYRAKVGFPLYSMKIHGKPFLGANVRMTGARADKAVSLSLLKRGRNPGGRGTVRRVPLYIGVKSVQIGKKFSVRAACDTAAAGLAQAYYRHFLAD